MKHRNGPKIWDWIWRAAGKFLRTMWRVFQQGRLAGTRGAAMGIVLLDEAHPAGARITLVRDAGTAPWAITCAIDGTFEHTAFAFSEGEARTKCEQMKVDLESILEESGSTPCYEKLRLFADLY